MAGVLFGGKIALFKTIVCAFVWFVVMPYENRVVTVHEQHNGTLLECNWFKSSLCAMWLIRVNEKKSGRGTNGELNITGHENAFPNDSNEITIYQ